MKKSAFQKAVEREFLFLDNEFHFKVDFSSLSTVRYESAKVYLEIFHDFRDGDIDIFFGRLSRKENFSFIAFLTSINPNLGKIMESKKALRNPWVMWAVKDFARVLHSEGQSILLGEDQVFNDMERVL